MAFWFIFGICQLDIFFSSFLFYTFILFYFTNHDESWNHSPHPRPPYYCNINYRSNFLRRKRRKKRKKKRRKKKKKRRRKKKETLRIMKEMRMMMKTRKWIMVIQPEDMFSQFWYQNLWRKVSWTSSKVCTYVHIEFNSNNKN